MTAGEQQRTDQGQAALADALQISFRVLRAVMLLLLVFYLASGVFVVRQHEKAFVLLFGKIAGTGEERILEPGIHWTFPRPMAEVVRIPTERVQSIESDTAWYYVAPEKKLRGEEPAPRATLDPRLDGCTLSGDANLLHSRWALRYTISRPEQYAFRFSVAEQVLSNELDHAVVKASAGFLIDQALRTDIEAYRAAVQAELDRRMQELELGVRIERVDIVAIAPPRQVAAAFDAVVQAEQERSRSISDARAYATRALNEANGDAGRIVAEGRSYQRRLISEVSANADYFKAVLAKYRKNPDITARTLLQDTLRRVLAHVETKYIVYRADTGEQQLWLQLSPESEGTGVKERP